MAAAFARILALVLVVVVLVWALSTDDQRRRLLVAFGIAEDLAQAEATGFSLVGPGFELELLPALPVTPMRYVFVPAPGLPTERVPDRASGPRGRDIAHGGDPCAPGRAAHPSQARASAPLYRYTDDDGRPVFSDRAPLAVAVEVVPVAPLERTRVGRFSATYDYQGLAPPPGFQHQLEIDLAGVFRFLAEGLRLGDPDPVHLNLRIIDGQRRFAAALAETSLAGADLGGFYRYATNQAVVRWQGETGTRAVARHEIAHLALGNWIGRVPLWLNEGLAEFVERMTFQQNFAIAEVSPTTLNRLQRLARQGALPQLRDFLIASRADWQRWGNDLAYPYAWSLVHFLVQEPSRQPVLSGLLQALAAQRCEPFDDVAYLARRYPGGIAGLARDWRQWLLAGDARPVQF